MGANKVKTHVLLSCISLIAGKLVLERLNSKQDSYLPISSLRFNKVRK